MRTAIYARYSSDLQSAASIEDQVRLCRERATREGHEVVEVYSDYAISGGHLASRPGMLSLLEGARAGDFDIVYADPPYDFRWPAAIEAILLQALRLDGEALVEGSAHSAAPPTIPGLHLVEERPYGDTVLRRYRRETPA